MNTLVLKCAEAVNNPNLRKISELRIGFNKQGDNSGRTRFGTVKMTNDDVNVIYKIVVGNGTFFDKDGNNLGDEC